MSTTNKLYEEILQKELKKCSPEFLNILRSGVSHFELNLRPDAELFLFANVRTMLWEPYVLKDVVSVTQFREGLGIILEGIVSDEQGLVSSHRVLRSVESNWGPLSTIFFWG
tara:strand:+ start:4292 stop:4627 length:336 start_codon:yes stop_codon:yes gene_type:complete